MALGPLFGPLACLVIVGPIAICQARKAKPEDANRKAGLITGIIGTVLGSIGLILFLVVLGLLFSEFFSGLWTPYGDHTVYLNTASEAIALSAEEPSDDITVCFTATRSFRCISIVGSEYIEQESQSGRKRKLLWVALLLVVLHRCSIS